MFLNRKNIKRRKLGKNFDKLNEFRSEKGREFILISQSLRKLELNYDIKITDDDLAYIVRMFLENVISV